MIRTQPFPAAVDNLAMLKSPMLFLLALCPTPELLDELVAWLAHHRPEAEA